MWVFLCTTCLKHYFCINNIKFVGKRLLTVFSSHIYVFFLAKQHLRAFGSHFTPKHIISQYLRWIVFVWSYFILFYFLALSLAKSNVFFAHFRKFMVCTFGNCPFLPPTSKICSQAQTSVKRQIINHSNKKNRKWKLFLVLL